MTTISVYDAVLTLVRQLPPEDQRRYYQRWTPRAPVPAALWHTITA